MMVRCPVCGTTSTSGNRFCGNCGAQLAGASEAPADAGGPTGPAPGATLDDLSRNAEQVLYELVKGVSRALFELRDQLETSRWAEQSRETVDQAVTRLKDAVEAGRRDYETRKASTGPRGGYGIPVEPDDDAGGASSGSVQPGANGAGHGPHSTGHGGPPTG